MIAEQLCTVLRDHGTQWANDSATLIETLRGALADIAYSDDMTAELARAKAKRVYLASGEPDENIL